MWKPHDLRLSDSLHIAGGKASFKILKTYLYFQNILLAKSPAGAGLVSFLYVRVKFCAVSAPINSLFSLPIRVPFLSMM